VTTEETATGEPSAPDAPTPAPPRSTPAWRTITSWVLLVVACVLVPVAGVAVWVRNLVLDSDRYVETVAPLAKNPDIQAQAVDAMVTKLFAEVDVEQELDSLLPSQLDFVAAPIAGAVESQAANLADTVVASDQFQAAWETANRKAHEVVVALLTGREDKIAEVKDGEIVLDLQQPLTNIRDRLVDRGLTFLEDVPDERLDAQFVLFKSEELQQAQDLTDRLDRSATWLPWLSLGLLAISVLLAGDRRKALVRAGIGIAIAAAVTALALAIGRSFYLDAADDAVSRDVALDAFQTLTRFLRSGIRFLFFLGLVIALGAWLAGPANLAIRIRALFTGGARSLAESTGGAPGGFSRWVSAHVMALRVAGIVAVVLVLVMLDQPRPRSLLFLGLLLVLYLLVVEFLAWNGREVPAEPSTGSSALTG